MSTKSLLEQMRSAVEPVHRPVHEKSYAVYKCDKCQLSMMSRAQFVPREAMCVTCSNTIKPKIIEPE